MPETHDLPDDVADLKRLVREHRLEIEVTQIEMSLQALEQLAPPTSGLWGEGDSGPTCANLDGIALGTVDVSACAAGDSAWGCRQMLGNVWEWTASSFEPYPGFAPDAYEDYSAPWFGTRKVLRGGAWMTRGRMISNTYRNFFTPEQRDVPAGFRTCAA